MFNNKNAMMLGHRTRGKMLPGEFLMLEHTCCPKFPENETSLVKILQSNKQNVASWSPRSQVLRAEVNRTSTHSQERTRARKRTCQSVMPLCIARCPGRAQAVARNPSSLGRRSDFSGTLTLRFRSCFLNFGTYGLALVNQIFDSDFCLAGVPL